jgi:hypothetical protein
LCLLVAVMRLPGLLSEKRLYLYVERVFQESTASLILFSEIDSAPSGILVGAGPVVRSGGRISSVVVTNAIPCAAKSSGRGAIPGAGSAV